MSRHFLVRRFDIASHTWTGLKLVDLVIRALRSAWTLVSFAVAMGRRRPSAVFCALSAGRAQAFDMACIAVGLVMRRPTYVMHHSYAVFDPGSDRPGLLRLARPLLRRCLHVVLCEDMKSALCAAWRLDAASVMVLSNATFVSKPPACPEDRPGRIRESDRYRLGFIANLREDKGLWTFLDVVSRLQGEGRPVGAIIAGPVDPADRDLERELAGRIAAMRDVEWVGALHGEERTRFYRQLDLLLFPSVYRHESEPHVILEALAHGVPVITTGRGCIPSALCDGFTVRTFHDAGFVDAAAAAIGDDMRRSHQSPELRTRCLRYFDALQHAGSRQFETLVAAVGQGTSRGADEA